MCTASFSLLAVRTVMAAIAVWSGAVLSAPANAPVRVHLEFGKPAAKLPSALSLSNGLHLQASMRAFDSTLYRNRSDEDVYGRLQWLSIGPQLDTVPLSGDSGNPLRIGLNLGVMVEGSPGLRHPVDVDPRDGLLNFRAYPAATFSMSWRFR